MIKLIREILVLPLWLFFFVCRLVPIVDQYTLLKLIWKVGRDVKVGCQLISMINATEGIEEARAFARQVLEEKRSAEAAMMIGLIEFRNYDCQRLRDWINLAEELGCADQEFLLILKIYCSAEFDEYDEEKLFKEMLACNYLPSWMSRYAHQKNGHLHLGRKLWNEAEEIADRLLVIAEDPTARGIKWVVSLQRGDEVEAKKHFALMRGDSPEKFHFLQVGEGYLFLDREQEAMEWFYKAKKAGLEWPYQKENPITNMLNSSKFKVYCAERE